MWDYTSIKLAFFAAFFFFKGGDFFLMGGNVDWNVPPFHMDIRSLYIIVIFFFLWNAFFLKWIVHLDIIIQISCGFSIILDQLTFILTDLSRWCVCCQWCFQEYTNRGWLQDLKRTPNSQYLFFFGVGLFKRFSYNLGHTNNRVTIA